MNIAILDTIGGLFKSVFGLADQVIVDKDKKNELNAKLYEIQANTTNLLIEAEREKIRLEAEITKAAITSDLPKWARILYLFGRQLYASVVVLIVAGFQAAGHPLDANTIMMMVAPGTAYAAVKGKGTKL